jgi:hypothetical protein
MIRYFLLLFLLIGCESPLLNHEKEGNSKPFSDLIFFESEALYATTSWIGDVGFAENRLEIIFYSDDTLTIKKRPT